MPGQSHVFTQIEWYIKLKERYKCTRVELEHRIEGYGICDVWGYNKEDKSEYIVEVGYNGDWKTKKLRNLEKRGYIKVFIVPINYEYDKDYFFDRKRNLPMRLWFKDHSITRSQRKNFEEDLKKLMVKYNLL